MDARPCPFGIQKKTLDLFFCTLSTAFPSCRTCVTLHWHMYVEHDITTCNRHVQVGTASNFVFVSQYMLRSLWSMRLVIVIVTMSFVCV